MNPVGWSEMEEGRKTKNVVKYNRTLVVKCNNNTILGDKNILEPPDHAKTLMKVVTMSGSLRVDWDGALQVINGN